jgi:hypothetical protein
MTHIARQSMTFLRRMFSDHYISEFGYTTPLHLKVEEDLTK